MDDSPLLCWPSESGGQIWGEGLKKQKNLCLTYNLYHTYILVHTSAYIHTYIWLVHMDKFRYMVERWVHQDSWPLWNRVTRGRSNRLYIYLFNFKILGIFWIIVLHQMNILQIFSSSFFFFILLALSFAEQKFLTLMRFSLLVLSCMGLCLLVLNLKIYYHTKGHLGFHLLFYSIFYNSSFQILVCDPFWVSSCEGYKVCV